MDNWRIYGNAWTKDNNGSNGGRTKEGRQEMVRDMEIVRRAWKYSGARKLPTNKYKEIV